MFKKVSEFAQFSLDCAEEAVSKTRAEKPFAGMAVVYQYENDDWEKGSEKKYFIAPGSVGVAGNQFTSDNDVKYASYLTGWGKLLEKKVDDYDDERLCKVLQKALYGGDFIPGRVDFEDTIFWKNGKEDPVTIESLRLLTEGTLQGQKLEPDVEQRIKPQDSSTDVEIASGNVKRGIQRKILMQSAVGDRDILDAQQGEIFRMPLNRQCVLLGSAGTGKTTTLIKRLAQKTYVHDTQVLTDQEREIIKQSYVDNNLKQHAQSWIMFSPSKTLETYLKEAFNRERVPASDHNIKNWQDYRKEIARNHLKILNTAKYKTGFSLRDRDTDPYLRLPYDPEHLFNDFQEYHKGLIQQKLEKALKILISFYPDGVDGFLFDSTQSGPLFSRFKVLAKNRDILQNEKQNLVKRIDLDGRDNLLSQFSDDAYKNNTAVWFNLAEFLQNQEQNDILTIDADMDENNEEWEENQDDIEISPTVKTKKITTVDASKIYKRYLIDLAVAQYNKRSLNKKWHPLQQYLKDHENMDFSHGTDLTELAEVKQKIGAINILMGLERNLYDSSVSAFKQWRSQKSIQEQFYYHPPSDRKHILPHELDLLILYKLLMVRDFLEQSYIQNAENIYRLFFDIEKSLFKNQILVDEVTDFTVVQIGCMYHLTDRATQSFFACGDFNQSLTRDGVKDKQQLSWALQKQKNDDLVKYITVAYRQGQNMHNFSMEILKNMDGDLESAPERPQHVNHTDYAPCLYEADVQSEQTDFKWIAQRIQEIDSHHDKNPTISILLDEDSYDKRQGWAELMQKDLDDLDLSLTVTVCSQNKGNDSHINVYSMGDVKGLEFEAVFLVDVNQMQDNLGELFDKYLYVSVTRAASYFAMTCERLPENLEPLRGNFKDSFSSET